MSEETKKERTLQDIQSEYQNAAMRAGHLEYQIYTLKRDLTLLNETMRDLNLEAASVQANKQKEESNGT